MFHRAIITASDHKGEKVLSAEVTRDNSITAIVNHLFTATDAEHVAVVVVDELIDRYTTTVHNITPSTFPACDVHVNTTVNGSFFVDSDWRLEDLICHMW